MKLYKIFLPCMKDISTHFTSSMKLVYKRDFSCIFFCSVQSFMGKRWICWIKMYAYYQCSWWSRLVFYYFCMDLHKQKQQIVFIFYQWEVPINKIKIKYDQTTRGRVYDRNKLLKNNNPTKWQVNWISIELCRGCPCTRNYCLPPDWCKQGKQE